MSIEAMTFDQILSIATLELFVHNTSFSLQLVRIWPVNATHLLLEYRTESGAQVSGQWMLESNKLIQLANTMCSQSLNKPQLIRQGSQLILLQPRGVDNRLRSLSMICRSANSSLLSHRPGKRAVLSWRPDGAEFFGKVFSTRGSYRRAAKNYDHAFTNSRDYRSPFVTRRFPHSRLILLSTVEGRSLHHHLCRGGLSCKEASNIGLSLRQLASIPKASHLRQHRAVDEADLLAKWLKHVSNFFPELSALMSSYCLEITSRLQQCKDYLVVSHRDLHDKQIFLANNQLPGFIDFDSLAVADLALDPANLLAHLELRQLQVICSEELRIAISSAFIEAYQPPDNCELQVYLDAARLRLACVYSFRPRWQELVKPLLLRIGQDWNSSICFQ